MATKRAKSPKPVWEPGYNGHVYWQGKQKLGKVSRHTEKNALYKYTWEAGGRAGGSDDLDQARRAVEDAVHLADKQLDLFGQ